MRAPLHPALTVHLRLPRRLRAGAPVEVARVGLGARNGHVADVSEDANRVTFILPGSQEGHHMP
eukprot:8349310-Lingulodinium_polyedra.AAC.1